MIRRVNHDRSIRVAREDIRQCEKHTRGGPAVLGLEDDSTLSPPRQLLENVSPVLGRSDHHSVIGASQSIRPIDGVLKERTGPYERTVLFRLVITEPLLDESPGSLSFAASKHDRPQLTGISAHAHLRPGLAFPRTTSV